MLEGEYPVRYRDGQASCEGETAPMGGTSLTKAPWRDVIIRHCGNGGCQHPTGPVDAAEFHHLAGLQAVP